MKNKSQFDRTQFFICQSTPTMLKIINVTNGLMYLLNYLQSLELNLLIRHNKLSYMNDVYLV